MKSNSVILCKITIKVSALQWGPLHTEPESGSAVERGASGDTHFKEPVHENKTRTLSIQVESVPY